MVAVPTDSMMLTLAVSWILTLSHDVVTFIFSYEFQCRWQISKLWWRERTALIWKRKVPLNKIRYDFQIILSSSVCTMQLVTTVGPSLVAMPVWLGCVCVCVCVCVRARAQMCPAVTHLLNSVPFLPWFLLHLSVLFFLSLITRWIPTTSCILPLPVHVQP